MSRGILYVGIGQSRNGVLGRVRNEAGWIGEESDHGHGMAMHRRDAAAVVGVVEPIPVDLDWLEDRIVERGAGIVRAWLDSIKIGPDDLLTATEHLAIRICIHLADVGAPVNSVHAGAWESDHAADWAAYAIAHQLKGSTPRTRI